jgi:hypothetical protein
LVSSAFSEPGLSVQQLVFFSIVRSHVGREKTIGVGPDLARFASSAMLVRQLDVLIVDTIRTSIVVSLDGLGQATKEPFVMAVGALSISDLSSLRKWESSVVLDALPSSVMSNIHPSLVDEARVQVSNLLAARALPGAAHIYTLVCDLAGYSPSRAALDTLATLGVVSLAKLDGGVSSWRLSETGMAILHVRQVLKNPQRALVPRCGVPPGDMSAFELLLALQSEGWALVEAEPPSRRNPRPLPYSAEPAADASSDRFIWIRKGTPRMPRWYMLALLQADKHGKRVPALEPERFLRTAGCRTGHSDAAAAEGFSVHRCCIGVAATAPHSLSKNPATAPSRCRPG